jgi:RNA polymerase sigma-70 factor (ECF subfamily)
MKAYEDSTPRLGWLPGERNMMVIDGRGAPFGNQTNSPEGARRPPGPGEGNSPPDRLLVGHALAQLSAEHRAVICRSYCRGWTTAQIAADLGIAEGMAKARLHYALHALRQALPKQATGTWSSNWAPSPTAQETPPARGALNRTRS